MDMRSNHCVNNFLNNEDGRVWAIHFVQHEGIRQSLHKAMYPSNVQLCGDVRRVTLVSSIYGS